MPDLGYLLDEKEGENKVMKKKHLLGVILFFCVVLATIIFALDRMDVISEGVALFINVSGELAKASYTSKATVVRLSQKLGLNGFQDLKITLTAEINQKSGSINCLQTSR